MKRSQHQYSFYLQSQADADRGQDSAKLDLFDGKHDGARAARGD